MIMINCRNVVDIIIDFPKPLVAVVNGPAVGIAATILGLMDAVYCTEKVFYKANFSKIVRLDEYIENFRPGYIHHSHA